MYVFGKNLEIYAELAELKLLYFEKKYLNVIISLVNIAAVALRLANKKTRSYTANSLYMYIVATSEMKNLIYPPFLC